MEGAEVDDGDIFRPGSSPVGLKEREEYARRQRERIDQRCTTSASDTKSSAKAASSLFMPKKKQNPLSGSQGSSQGTSTAIIAKRRRDRDALHEDLPSSASSSTYSIIPQTKEPRRNLARELSNQSSALNKLFATSTSQRGKVSSSGLTRAEMERRDEEVRKADERKADERRKKKTEAGRAENSKAMSKKQKGTLSKEKAAENASFNSIFETWDKLRVVEARGSSSAATPERRIGKNKSKDKGKNKSKDKGKDKGGSQHDGIDLISPAKNTSTKGFTKPAPSSKHARCPPSSDYESMDEDEDEDDPLAMGKTPPRHMHDNYRSSHAPSSSRPPASSQSRFGSAVSDQELVPDSDGESSLRQSSTGSRGGKRRFSERAAVEVLSDDDDDYYVGDQKKKKKKRTIEFGSGKIGKPKAREEREESVEYVPPDPKSRATATNPFHATSQTKSTALPPDKSAPKLKAPAPPERQKNVQKSISGKRTIVSDDEASSEEELDELAIKQKELKAQSLATEKSMRAHDRAKKEEEAKKKEEDEKRVAKKGKKSADKQDKGHSFFEMLEKMDVHDNLEEFDDEFLDGPSINLDTTMEEEEDDDWLDDEYTEAQRAWILRHVDRRNLCPYCDEPLPFNPTDHIKNLRLRLEKLSKPAPTSKNPNARALSWQQAIEFCTLHRAEATIIPLGIHAGYPETIDFRGLDRRLEEGWAWSELEKIVKDPSKSKIFREVKKEVEGVGKMRWSSIKNQSKVERLAAVKPGYYGELGRVIMTDHFQKLRQWNYLYPCVPPARPGSDITDDLILPIDPLSPSDFIANVLVPEASIFLIMDDNQCRSFDEDAYEDAARMREESAKYGDTKFREGDRQAKMLLEELRKGAGEKRERLKRLMGRKKKKAGSGEGEENKENRRPPLSGVQTPVEIEDSPVKVSQQSSDMWEEGIDDDLLRRLEY
ncbi:hypothetical protein IAR50_003421 [Cryptococcus sp. DSM 104548]